MQAVRKTWCCVSALAFHILMAAGSVHAADMNAFVVHNAAALKAVPTHDTSGASIDAGALAQPEPLLHVWRAVDTRVLDTLRGGFVTNTGLQVSIGIERLVSINGELHTATRFEFQNTSQNGITLSLPANPMQLVQNGAGNLFSSGQLAQTSGGLFIQNSLNNQIISSVTIINATTNSLELLRGASLQSSLREAISDAAAAR